MSQYYQQLNEELLAAQFDQSVVFKPFPTSHHLYQDTYTPSLSHPPPLQQQQDTLFLGDLAIETTESVLKECFQCFGEILDVRVKCAASLGPEGGQKNLGYGFLKFAHPESAVLAMKEMDGFVLKGRPLRVGWAAKGKSAEGKNSGRRSAQVLTSFMGKDHKARVNEEVLRSVFHDYGTVVDATIKKSKIDPKTKLQTGYGFIHFEDSPEGIQSALTVIENIHNVVIGNISYDCRMSDSLKLRLEGKEYSPPTAAMMINKKKSAITVASQNTSAEKQDGFKDLSQISFETKSVYNPQRHSLSVLERRKISTLPYESLPHFRSSSATVLMEEPVNMQFPIPEIKDEQSNGAGSRPNSRVNYERRPLPPLPFTEGRSVFEENIRELNCSSTIEDNDFFDRELRLNCSSLEKQLQLHGTVPNKELEDPYYSTQSTPFWQTWVASVREDLPRAYSAPGGLTAKRSDNGTLGSLPPTTPIRELHEVSSLSTTSTASLGIANEDGRNFLLPDFHSDSLDILCGPNPNYNSISVDHFVSGQSGQAGEQRPFSTSLLPTTRSAHDQYTMQGYRHLSPFGGELNDFAGIL